MKAVKMTKHSAAVGLLLSVAFWPTLAAGVFDNVALFERALVTAGFPAATWRPMSGMFYGSSQIVLPNTNGAVISYAIQGTTRTRVARANISTLVNVAADAPKANAKLADVTAQWCKAAGLAVPSGLLQAIRAGKKFEATASGIKVSVIRQAGDVVVRLEPI